MSSSTTANAPISLEAPAIAFGPFAREGATAILASAAGAALLAFLSAGVVLIASQQSHQFAFLWPLTGLLTAYLLCFPQLLGRNVWIAAAAIAMGAAVSGTVIGRPLLMSLQVSLRDAGSCVLAATLLRHHLRTRHDLRTREVLLRVACVALLVSVVNPAVGCWQLAAIFHQPVLTTFLHLVLAHLLGFSLLLPITFDLICAVRGERTSLQLRPVPLALELLLFAAVAVFACFFARAQYLFLVFPIMRLVVNRSGFSGGALCSIVLLPIAWLSFIHTTQAGVTIFGGMDPVHQLLRLQTYLGAFYVNALWSGLAQDGRAQAELLLMKARNGLAEKVGELEISMQRSSTLLRQLEDSEELFRAFMHHSPTVSYIKDAEGRYCFYNRRTAEQFEVALDTWIGKTDAEIFPEPIATKLRSADEQVLAQHGIIEFDEETVNASGQWATWKSYKFPFMDASGRRFLAGISLNVTKERTLARDLEQSAAQLRKANEVLHELTLMDPLTQTHNRRHYDRAIQERCTESMVGGQPVCVLMIDVDHFKNVNDTHGHAFGDEVLRRIGQIVKGAVRGDDQVCRVGGEEFAVLLANTSLAQAGLLAGRIRQAVASAPWPKGPVTISIGVGGSELLSGCEPQQLSALADAALYEAKAAGRDRVHVARVPQTA